MTRTPLAAVAGFALLVASPAQRLLADAPAPDIDAGDKVVVASKEVQLRSGETVVATVPKGQRLLVRERRFFGGDWWVKGAVLDDKGETSPGGSEGWARADRVLVVPSLPSAGEGKSLPKQYVVLATCLSDFSERSRRGIDKSLTDFCTPQKMLATWQNWRDDLKEAGESDDKNLNEKLTRVRKGLDELTETFRAIQRAPQVGEWKPVKVEYAISLETTVSETKFAVTGGYLHYVAKLTGKTETRSQTKKEEVKGEWVPNDDYKKLKKTLLDDINQITEAQLQFPRVAGKYSGRKVSRGQSVLIDADAPLRAAQGGYLRLANNTEATLTNCTVQAVLKGKDETAHVILFVPEWKPGAADGNNDVWFFGDLGAVADGNRYGQKFAADLQSVVVSLWCDQLAQENMEYSYEGREKDYDAYKLFEKVKMSAKYEEKSDETETRVVMHFGGLPSLPDCKIKVRLTTADTDPLEVTKEVDFSDWKESVAKEVSFPGTKGALRKFSITIQMKDHPYSKEWNWGADGKALAPEITLPPVPLILPKPKD